MGSNPTRSLLYIIYHCTTTTTATTTYLLLQLLLRSVFREADSFNADIGGWDTSAATDMVGSEYIRVVFYL